MNGNYSSLSLPFYLRKENYYKIKSNIDNIELVHSNIMDLDDNLSFDFLNLSDIFEYMSEADFQKNTEKLLKLTQEGSRIAYWNMQNKRYFQTEKFLTDKKNNCNLFIKNKSFFYRDFSIYVRML